MRKCYDCAYAQSIPGSCHTRCAFDWRNSELPPPRGRKHGIENGWWLFPLNFDPVWMQGQCPAWSDQADEASVAQLDPLDELLSLMGKRAFR